MARSPHHRMILVAYVLLFVTHYTSNLAILTRIFAGRPLQVIRYIHRNPVKRELVASPGDYQWNSFNHYATGVRGAVEIESE